MPTSNLERFAGKLKQLTEFIGVSQAEIARRVGMQPSHLNLFLQGRGDLHAQRLIGLLLELGIDLEGQVDEALDRLGRRAKSKKSETVTEFEQLISQLQQVPRAERESLSLIIARLSKEKNQNAHRKGAGR